MYTKLWDAETPKLHSLWMGDMENAEKHARAARYCVERLTKDKQGDRYYTQQAIEAQKLSAFYYRESRKIIGIEQED